MSPGLISQCDYIFRIFVYLHWTRCPSALQGFVIFLCCKSVHQSKIHSSSDNNTQNTHRRSLIRMHIAYRGACPPPPTYKASSCSTYTHSFPLLPPSLPLQLAPRVLRLSCTFMSLCCLFESLLSVYESLSLSLRVHLLISLSPPIFVFFFPLSQPLSPWGRKKKEQELQTTSRSQNRLNLNFITNKPAHCKSRMIRREK